jgi:hypothetical protein
MKLWRKSYTKAFETKRLKEIFLIAIQLNNESFNLKIFYESSL